MTQPEFEKQSKSAGRGAWRFAGTRICQNFDPATPRPNFFSHFFLDP